MNKIEIRVPILWYEQRYEVSSLWRVRSKWRPSRVDTRWRALKGISQKILSPRKSSDMWHTAVLLRNKTTWVCMNYKVHRLVAQAFLGLDIEFKDPKISMCVCHKDDDPMNNSLDNLFLATNKWNNADMFSKGRRIYSKWTDVHNSKYSSEEIIMIRSMYRDWTRQRAIALIFNTTQQHISLICKNKIYQNII